MALFLLEDKSLCRCVDGSYAPLLLRFYVPLQTKQPIGYFSFILTRSVTIAYENALIIG
jgi:hypothetical protein